MYALYKDSPTPMDSEQAAFQKKLYWPTVQKGIFGQTPDEVPSGVRKVGIIIASVSAAVVAAIFVATISLEGRS